MTDNIPSADIGHRQTPGILQVTIDNSLVNTQIAGVALRRFYRECSGVERAFYFAFHDSFSLLVTLTAGTRDVDLDNETVKRCVEWINIDGVDRMLNHSRDIDKSPLKSHALCGVELAREYGVLLNKAGICSTRT